MWTPLVARRSQTRRDCSTEAGSGQLVCGRHSARRVVALLPAAVVPIAPELPDVLLLAVVVVATAGVVPLTCWPLPNVAGATVAALVLPVLLPPAPAVG